MTEGRIQSASPFIIRRVLDELVDVGDGMYLGKVLYRLRARFHLTGFFTLEK